MDFGGLVGLELKTLLEYVWWLCWVGWWVCLDQWMILYILILIIYPLIHLSMVDNYLVWDLWTYQFYRWVDEKCLIASLGSCDRFISVFWNMFGWCSRFHCHWQLSGTDSMIHPMILWQVRRTILFKRRHWSELCLQLLGLQEGARFTFGVRRSSGRLEEFSYLEASILDCFDVSFWTCSSFSSFRSLYLCNDRG